VLLLSLLASVIALTDIVTRHNCMTWTHPSHLAVHAGPGAVGEVVQTIKNSRDLSIDFTVARPSGVEHVQVLPDIGSDGKGKIGVQLAGNVDIERRKANGVGELLVRSGEEVSRLLVATVDGLKGLIGNFDAAKESVSSPVAVVAVGSQVARESPAGMATLHHNSYILQHRYTGRV
jgi:hypothetical protein